MIKTAIERTAYPRFVNSREYSQRELHDLFTPSSDEIYYAENCTRNDDHLLYFLLKLKSFQKLGYFVDIGKIPQEIVKHVASQIQIPIDELPELKYKSDTILYSHRKMIREYVGVKPFDATGRKLLDKAAMAASKTMNKPADIINSVIDNLILHRYELPAFSAIDRTIRCAKNQVNQELYYSIYNRLPENLLKSYEDILKQKANSSLTLLSDIKKLPKKVSPKNFYDYLALYDWINSFGEVHTYLKNIPKTKIVEFSGEAKIIDASDFKNLKLPKRYSLLTSLLYDIQSKSRDNLAKMFCKMVSKWHKKAKMKLESLQSENIRKAEKIASIMSNIIDLSEEPGHSTADLTSYIESALEINGGGKKVKIICDDIIAYAKQQYLFLVSQFISTKQKAMVYSFLSKVKIKTSTQDRKVVKAAEILTKHKNSDILQSDIDISFVSAEWKKLLTTGNKKSIVDKRHLEACIFSIIAQELNSGDVFIEGSNIFSDYRLQLLDWNVCKDQVKQYCDDLGLPNTPKEFVKKLRQTLTTKIKKLDEQYDNIKGFTIVNGSPKLNTSRKLTNYKHKTALQKTVDAQMPERNIIDILCSTHHYTRWAKHFGPISGSEPRTKSTLEKYIITTFAYGSSMGPTQASKHFKNIDATPHILSWINRRHITLMGLDSSIGDLVNASNKFQITNIWGDGKSCAADGTICKIYEDNLLSEHHIRYGIKGGIAYYHIANNYVALFSTLIPCGVWEAIAIIDGVLNTKSDIKPDTIHSDTQGQSATVFGLSYLLGIKLMPRIRNWKNYTLYKSSNSITYKNIEPLFVKSGKTKAINWHIIESHWNDFMQVVLSIKAGTISTSFLLRKLTNYARKNKLFKVLNELGKVIRTLFLIDYVSNVDLRDEITANTNKVESYNKFSEWLRFGEEYYIVASNDPDEQEKAVKYNCLMASAIILQNIVDMTNIVKNLLQSGKQITDKDIAKLSPYITHHIKRFGDYLLDIRKAKLISKKQNTDIWVS